MRVRQGGVFCFLWIAACALVPLGGLLAQTNPTAADDIPTLRPPHPEIPPTYWEQHGSTVIAMAAALAVLLCGLVWWARRSRPRESLAPEAEARKALEQLRSQPEDGKVLSRVSQILRRYFVRAFGLPLGEATTTEFCKAFAANESAGPQLTAAAGGFLQQCDVRKFAPATPEGSLAAVPRALQLIEQAESRLAELRKPVPT